MQTVPITEIDVYRTRHFTAGQPAMVGSRGAMIRLARPATAKVLCLTPTTESDNDDDMTRLFGMCR